MRHAKRIRTSAFLLCATFLLCAIFPISALAAEDAPQTVKVGFFAMDGYHVEDENGVRSGYGYDFLQLVARYSDLRFEYIGYDKGWDEMQRMLENGEIDLLTSAQKTPEREERFDFSAQPIGTSAAILTVKAGNNRYSGGNYDGMRVGLVENNSRNAQLEALMAERGFTYSSIYYPNMNAVTAALQSGADIDAAMTSNLRWTNNEWVLEKFSSSPFYAMVRKGDSALISVVDAAIERMDMDSPGWRTRLFNNNYSMDSSDAVPFSSEERAYLDALAASGRTLTVTMNPDCAPYSYFENGKPKGIIPAVFAEVASRMGVSYEIIEPADRDEYKRLCVDREVDIILDGMDDFHTTETGGFEITDVYYTTPLAMLTEKSNSDNILLLAQPRASVLNEAAYADLFAGKTVMSAQFDTQSETADSVKTGKADGAYMPYYCAKWLSGADVTGKLQCLIMPNCNRAFVYAVNAGEDYPLVCALNKAVGSLSDNFTASVVAAETIYPDDRASLIGFLYQNPVWAILVVVVFFAVVIVVMLLISKNHRAQKELARSRRIERYIGYLCDMYYKVLEVDLERKSRKQYMKRGGKVEIEEIADFTAFDIDNLHPDDFDGTLAVFDPSAIRALFASGEDERYVESRMKTDTGEYRWYSFLLKLVPRDEEHPCSAVLLIKDVDDLHCEREKHNASLMNALNAANTSSRSKSKFLSSISHEIRTPLNAMIGYMTIAQTSIDNREKVLHCINSAGVAAKHLLSIINDVLDVSAMESGKIKLAKARFDLKEQLNGITSVFYQQCKQKGVQFSISVTGLSEEWVVGDPLRVNQILMNLMSNAVKFTDKDGIVSLAVVQTTLNTEQVVIQFIVKDTGIGMSEEYLDRLFSPFEQESAETAQKYGGTGLGMSIAYNLVNLMGGKIDVSSKQGDGTIFTVALPFGRTENEGTKQTPADLSQLHVLIVDDHENECDYVRALLSRCGVKSESAHSGEDAIRAVSKYHDTPEKIDLCIIDWNMPGLNGGETTRMIHQTCDPNIPIIIATAYDISGFEEEAMAAGAIKVVSKPLFQSTLFDLLISAYGKYDAALNAEEEIPDLAGMCVLLAEDNEMNVEVAIEILEIAGVAVEVARNGREAVDRFLAESGRYDAILMDVQMPIMDGYAATKAIRAATDARARTIPIIAMTANAFAEDVSASLASGMNGHLSKPIETRELFKTLKRIGRK